MRVFDLERRAAVRKVRPHKSRLIGTQSAPAAAGSPRWTAPARSRRETRPVSRSAAELRIPIGGLALRRTAAHVSREGTGPVLLDLP